MAQDITVTPSNSPYQIQAGTQNYGTVTISGGFLQLQQQTNLGIEVIKKTTTTKASLHVTEKR